MAPKGGRGGSSSSSRSSISSCPGAFSTTLEQASFALDVVFLVIYIGIFIALFSIRKKGVAGKKLIGMPFIAAVFFFALANACSLVATVLQQCNTTDIYSEYSWFIAIGIFGYLSYWFLLVVVVYTLNTMLQKQLSHSKTISNIIVLVIIGLMGLLSITLAGMGAYINYEAPRLLYYSNDSSDIYTVSDALVKLRTAYYALFLVSLLTSGGLGLATLLSLRRERKAAASLIAWVIALTAAMLLWVIILIVTSAWYLQGIDYTQETSIILSYILSFGQALACIVILFIAKQACWGSQITTDPMTGTAAYAPVTYPQPYAYDANTNNQAYQPPAQYAYNGNPNGQAYQYNQTPELFGTTHPIK